MDAAGQGLATFIDYSLNFPIPLLNRCPSYCGLSSQNHNWYGSSVTLNENFLAIGASLRITEKQIGATFIYRLEDNGSATFLSKITAPDKEAGDQFGNALSQTNDILTVGAVYGNSDGFNNAGAAYIYQIENNGSATLLTKHSTG